MVAIARPAQLMERIIEYLTHHGLAELSLRPLARAVGSSPRVLLYYFGSKDALVAEVFVALRERQRAQLATLPARGFAADCWAAWKHMTTAESLRYSRLFFEAVGIAIRQPAQHRAFLAATVEDWLAALVGPLRAGGASMAEARTLATIVIAGLRGFMLDLCTTDDARRVDRAVRAWIAAIDPEARPPAGSRRPPPAGGAERSRRPPPAGGAERSRRPPPAGGAERSRR
jgi:AcrR family transcriptional regulator